MIAESARAVFDWDFVSLMTAMSVTVVAVANTLGSISDSGRLPFRIGRLWAAFIASLILTVYAVYRGDGWSWHPRQLAEVLAFAFILFCISAGGNQSVGALARRIGAARGPAPGPEGAPTRGRWWASWF